MWYVLEADHQFESSVNLVVTRANEKCYTHTRQDSQAMMVSRMMLLERRLRRRLCRIIARIVSSNMPACRLDGVVHLILDLFVALVASPLDPLYLTVCDLCYECSGVLMFLISSVWFGTTIYELSTLNLGRLWMVCFSWRTVTDLQLHRGASHFELQTFCLVPFEGLGGRREGGQCAHSALDAKVISILEGKMLVTSRVDAQYQDGGNFDGPGQLTSETSDHGRQESHVDGSVVPNEAPRQPTGDSACHALLLAFSSRKLQWSRRMRPYHQTWDVRVQKKKKTRSCRKNTGTNRIEL